jgi:hypothetical protein
MGFLVLNYSTGVCLFRQHIRWKLTSPCKLWKLQSKSHDLDLRESSCEVEGVIWKIHGRWEAWFEKVILQITPSTSHKLSLESRSCDSDWSFHSLHGEVSFHVICCRLFKLYSSKQSGTLVDLLSSCFGLRFWVG